VTLEHALTDAATRCAVDAPATGVAYEVGPADRCAARGVTVVQAAGRAVAVFHVDGAWFAVDDACPHHGASLADGGVRGTVVRCPWHEWPFDLTTGECQRSPARVATHDVEVRDGVVHVHVGRRPAPRPVR
jgi:nitrite reductase/ring-hydroxylating ferredoxin subunit